MYNWINKRLLISQADSLLRIDDFIPNAFLTILMESNQDLFKKVNEWISTHQEVYSKNARKRALIGSDLIALDKLEKEEVLSFVELYPSFRDLIVNPNF